MLSHKSLSFSVPICHKFPGKITVTDWNTLRCPVSHVSTAQYTVHSTPGHFPTLQIITNQASETIGTRSCETVGYQGQLEINFNGQCDHNRDWRPEP